MTAPLEIAVLGDLHGAFDAALDAPLLERHPVRLCTGDLTPNRGAARFDEALRIARELASCRAYTVLGNHDGPTAFTGRRFPRSYEQLVEALGEHHLSARRLDLPALDLSIVGARPLTCGGEEAIRFAVPGREDWTLERWGDEIGRMILEAPCTRVLVLAHDGPAGLGVARDSIYGVDFRPDAGDWGDIDLRRALDIARAAGREPVAVVAGHMHSSLRGGGERRLSLREGRTLHVNAAIVPRVTERGRAITIVTLDGDSATAEVRWG